MAASVGFFWCSIIIVYVIIFFSPRSLGEKNFTRTVNGKYILVVYVICTDQITCIEITICESRSCLWKSANVEYRFRYTSENRHRCGRIKAQEMFNECNISCRYRISLQLDRFSAKIFSSANRLPEIWVLF